jgi:hypothetical protein
MTTIEAGRAGTIRSDTVRAPFRCAACGELLYTRALVCPHCGAPDPASAVEAATAPAAVVAVPEPPVEALRPPSTDDRPAAAEAAAAELPAVATPAIDATSAPIVESTAAGVADAAPEPTAYAELEPVEEPAPRTPRPPTGARLDIAPDPYDDDLSDSRDLVLVPERGGRTVMLPEPRRRGRLLGIGLTLLVLLGIGAAGVLGWRMLAGPAAVASQELSVGTGWTAVELDDAGPGEWVVTADAPFRIRVDGTVYTVGGPSGFAVPLTGRSVAVRAVSGTAKVTLARR